MKKALFICSFVLLTRNICAASWSETSVSYLNGSGYEVGTNHHRTILTYEHASGWNYGDHFIFIDVTNPLSRKGSANTEVYGEWAPRFSMGKIFNFYNNERFVQDMLVVGNIEHGRSGVSSRALLYGFGMDLNIPGFKYFKYSFMRRDNPDSEGTTFQSTFAWDLPIKISKVKLSFSGYLDIVHGSEGMESDFTLVESHLHTAPQLLLDLGHFFNNDDVLYSGIEYQYWNRKFGIKGGAVENNLQWMLKWIF